MKIALVGEPNKGHTAGRAVWCDVHELLEGLPDGVAVVPHLDKDEELRRMARLELHVSEQRRLALVALRRGEKDPRMAIPDDSMQVPGIDGLLRQLDNAAPTPLIEAGKPSSANELLVAGKGGARPAQRQQALTRPSSAATLRGWG